ncbi:MAG: 5-methyltetrahydropteroyltriglutamate--homocysteine S-methyltransferase [Gemmatimonadota bacterium]
MTISATTGFPRIGPDRELKRALESYWGGRLEAAGLRAQAAELRAGSWRLQQEAGISHIPSNDFSLYDHVLDTAVLLGAVPGRYGWSPGHEVDLDTYFAMARGAQTEGLDVPAMEMTKWFDTNYHYIVPELERDQAFGVSSSKPFDELAEARDLGIETRPVLLGPVSFLLLSKPVGDFRPLDVHLEAVAGTYAEIVGRLAALGARWIQLDEPCFVADRAPDEIAALETAYEVLAKAAGDARLLVHTYFGDVGDAYPTLVGLPVGGLGLDFVRGTRNLELLQRHGFPDGMVLQAGLVDGRNVWITDLEAAGRRMDTIGDVVDRDRLIVSPSCSLLHVPYDAERETEIEAEIRPWLSFARQKLDEVVALARWGASGREDLADVLERNRTAAASRAASRLTHDPSVRDRLADLDPFAACRDTPFAERRSLQRERLGLPTLPTTSIGSFPQHAEVRRQRRLHRSGELGDDAYRDFVRHEMARAIGLQERAGLDVLVHGEPERNDMVEYFGERFAGFAFSRHGWVQSYGSRCVKPPILYGDVRRPSPVTVEWWRLAQGLTDRPIKGMLTGPVTLLQWSFVRDDQPRSETCFQLALAVRDEVADLETAGAAVVQVDEPALREGLPLRRGEWDEYLEWAVAAFRLATSGVEPHTQIHTHMCYCEFNDIIDHIARMDADVLLIENARSDAELLEVFREYEYDRDIGPGVYDIHSPRVPPADEMADRIRASLGVLAADRLWVNPDCGLKTRRYEEVEPALENLVEAARRVRAEVEAGSPADR